MRDSMIRTYQTYKKNYKGATPYGRFALFFGSAILLLRVFASQLMPESAAVGLLVLGVLCLFVYLCGRRKRFFKQNVRCLIWIIPAVYILFNAVVLGKFTWALALFLVAVAALMILPCGIDWIEAGFITLIGILAVFAVATLIFFAFPSLYAPVHSAFFVGYHGATGYQSGLTIHYSANGSFMALGLVLCASGMMFAVGKLKNKKLWLALTLLFLAALLLTAKRGPLLSAVIGLLVAFFVSDTRWKFSKFVVAGIVIACGILILSTFVPQVGDVFDRFSSITDGSSLEETTSGRTGIWAKAIEDWNTNPLLGIGWGRFIYTFPRGMLTVTLAHNELLHTLATLGIVGSVLLIIAELYTLHFTVRLAKIIPTGSSLRLYIYSSVAVQVLTLFYGYTSGCIIQIEYVSMPYIFAVAVAFAIANYDQRKSLNEKETSYEPLI